MVFYLVSINLSLSYLCRVLIDEIYWYPIVKRVAVTWQWLWMHCSKSISVVLTIEILWKFSLLLLNHYSYCIMSEMAFQISGVSIVCSTVCWSAGQRKHQSSAPLAFVRETTGHRWFPSQRASNPKFDVFFDCVWINGWVNNRQAGDLRRHRAHYVGFIFWLIIKWVAFSDLIRMIGYQYNTSRMAARISWLETNPILSILMPLQWRHNGRHNVSNHQPHHCLLNLIWGADQSKHQHFLVSGLCAGDSPVTSEFPAQMSSNAENISIWWRHHGIENKCPCLVKWRSKHAVSKILFYFVKYHIIHNPLKTGSYNTKYNNAFISTSSMHVCTSCNYTHITTISHCNKCPF